MKKVPDTVPAYSRVFELQAYVQPDGRSAYTSVTARSPPTTHVNKSEIPRRGEKMSTPLRASMRVVKLPSSTARAEVPAVWFTTKSHTSTNVTIIAMPA